MSGLKTGLISWREEVAVERGLLLGTGSNPNRRTGNRACDLRRLAVQASTASTKLLTEARRLQDLTSDPIIRQFANDVIELAGASIATGNPIVF